MEAQNTMRKMMMATLLMAGACGAVVDPNATNDGAGSDSGSGTASSSGESGSGSTGMDAGVMGTMTIDSSDFLVDGTTWWSSNAAPILHGTFQGPSSAVIQAKVGTQGTAATLNGSTWTVQLPANSISSSNVTVTMAMTDPGGGLVELAQHFGLDAAAPSISAAASLVRDERADTIDFSTGEPVHTHVGTQIDLAGGGCPAVYKYGYLMDTTAPLYGINSSPNPLVWRFKIADAKLKTGTEAIRIRDDNGVVLMNWTAIPSPDSTGTYSVELTRRGGAYPVESLGTRTGKFYVDVRASDWANQEAVSSFCWDHHPLAAPVDVSPYAGALLFGMRLPLNSPLSRVLNNNGSMGVLFQRITQQTAEPVTLTWSATPGAAQYNVRKFAGYVVEQFNASVSCPSGTTKPECRTNWAPTTYAPRLTTSTGVASMTYWTVLSDDTSGTILQTSNSLTITATLLPRGANEPPHAYRIEIVSGPIAELRPEPLDTGSLYGEYAMMGTAYTGVASQDLGQSCANLQQTAWGPYCYQVNQYLLISALDQARMDFSFTTQLATAANAQQPLAPVSYVSANVLSSGVMSWDSGDDDLPGPN